MRIENQQHNLPLPQFSILNSPAKGAEELPQGQAEEDALLVVPDFFVDPYFYVVHLSIFAFARQTVANAAQLWYHAKNQRRRSPAWRICF